MKELEVGRYYPTWKLYSHSYVFKFFTKGMNGVYENETHRITYDSTSGKIIAKEKK